RPHPSPIEPHELRPIHRPRCSPRHSRPNRARSSEGGYKMTRIAAPKLKQPAVTSATPMLQRKCDCGRKLGAGHECEECKKKREQRLNRSATDRKSVVEGK